MEQKEKNSTSIASLFTYFNNHSSKVEAMQIGTHTQRSQSSHFFSLKMLHFFLRPNYRKAARPNRQNILIRNSPFFRPSPVTLSEDFKSHFGFFFFLLFFLHLIDYGNEEARSSLEHSKYTQFASARRKKSNNNDTRKLMRI